MSENRAVQIRSTNINYVRYFDTHQDKEILDYLKRQQIPDYVNEYFAKEALKLGQYQFFADGSIIVQVDIFEYNKLYEQSEYLHYYSPTDPIEISLKKL